MLLLSKSMYRYSKYKANILKALKVKVLNAENCPLWLVYYSVLYHYIIITY